MSRHEEIIELTEINPSNFKQINLDFKNDTRNEDETGENQSMGEPSITARIEENYKKKTETDVNIENITVDMVEI